jgi:hypothetical protein
MVPVFIVTHLAMIICFTSIFYRDLFYARVYYPLRVRVRFVKIQLTKPRWRILKMVPKRNLLNLVSKVNLLIVILFN